MPNINNIEFPEEGMRVRVNHEKGLTLIEILGALTVLGIVMGVLLFALNQTHGSVAKITARESAIDESRTIVNHIVKSARSGLRYDATGSAGGYVLSLTGDGGQYIRYTFNPASHTVSMDAMLATGADGSLAPQHVVFSSHVSNLTVTPSEYDSRLAVALDMIVPEGPAYRTTTMVYLLNKS